MHKRFLSILISLALSVPIAIAAEPVMPGHKILDTLKGKNPLPPNVSVLDLSKPPAVDPAIVALFEKSIDLRDKPDNSKQMWNYLLDRSGKTTELPFEDVKRFSPDRFVATKSGIGGRSFVLDDKGQELFDANVNITSPLSDGLATYTAGNFVQALLGKNRIGYLDEELQPAIKQEFLDAQPFSEGLAAVSTPLVDSSKPSSPTSTPPQKPILSSRIQPQAKWSYITKSGTTAIYPQFDKAGPFQNGFAPVKLGDKWTYTDKQGTVFPDRFDQSMTFNEELAAVRIGDKWGYLSTSGKMAIKPVYENVRNFSEGLAAVREEGKVDFIDKNGKRIIRTKYSDAMEFHDGLCRVANGTKWGFIDRKGKVLVEPKYAAAQDFQEGVAAVCLDYKWGFIDRSGNTVIEPTFMSVTSFEKGTALASVKNWKHPIPRMMLMLFHLSDLKFREDASSKTGFYIPENLDDAMNELSKIMPPKAVQDIMIIPEDQMLNYHMGFGTSMRNSWGLWGGERLSQYFNKKGISHPEEMSSAIFKSYWRKLHGMPIEVN